MKTHLLIITFLSFSSFANAADLVCEANSKKAPARLQTFIIGDAQELFHGENGHGANLVDLDARQVDPGNYTVSKGVEFISVDLNNGCDNNYTVRMVTQDLRDVLSGKKKSVKLNLEYAYQGEEEVIGKLTATCKLN